MGRELEKRGSRPRLTIAEGLEICVCTLFFDRAGVRLKTDTQSVRMRDGIRLYWDRDETAIAATAKKFKDCEDAEECVDEIAGLLYAMPEISADERLTAVMEVLEERGITTETLAEIFLFAALHLTGYLAPPSPFAPNLFAWFYLAKTRQSVII